MIIAIGDTFWGKGASERLAFEAAKKHAPHGRRVSWKHLDYYWIPPGAAKEATVDEVGNLVMPKGKTATKLTVTRLPKDDK